MSLNENFKTWDVKLIWQVIYPSTLLGGEGDNTFEVFGVDRSSITISRNLTRINSLEQYGQGYLNGVPDIRVTILEKESGPSFDLMRRLSASNIPFDLELQLINSESDNQAENDWMDGYEKFLGCRVVNERTNYGIAEFPVREFECMALRHQVSKGSGEITLENGETVTVTNAVIEGDGSYNSSITFDITENQ